jgi:hypothetical protein
MYLLLLSDVTIDPLAVAAVATAVDTIDLLAVAVAAAVVDDTIDLVVAAAAAVDRSISCCCCRSISLLSIDITLAAEVLLLLSIDLSAVDRYVSCCS